jgi:hypothetical protein
MTSVQEHQRVGLGADRAGRRHLVGVDVVVLAVKAERDRTRSPAPRPSSRSPPASSGSVAAISPTKPRSGTVFFLRARNTGHPRRPKTHRRLAKRAAARPPATCSLSRRSTISATSRVSASVTRRPLINSLCLPSAFSVLVNCTPPPCTTATWLPSRTSSAQGLLRLV